MLDTKRDLIIFQKKGGEEDTLDIAKGISLIPYLPKYGYYCTNTKTANQF